ncbi:MAG: hypothetical protein K2X03_24270 [Bryobacteraceae bacterium]|nr:hypothetical protein [Bryobacteraceae bacterium]
MTIDQRIAELTASLQLLTMKSSSHDTELNQLTKNLNELTLKVDVFASQQREEQQVLAQSQHQLTESHLHLAAQVSKLIDVQSSTLATVRELTAVVGRHEERLRKLEP